MTATTHTDIGPLGPHDPIPGVCDECGECDCICSADSDYPEDLDGDHETALESVYGPDNDCGGEW